jgi:hypothetical protein
MYFFQSIETFINDNLFDSRRGHDVNLVLRIITDNKEGILSPDLTRATKSLTIRDRQEIIRDLIASKQIVMKDTTEPGIVLFKRVDNH